MTSSDHRTMGSDVSHFQVTFHSLCRAGKSHETVSHKSLFSLLFFFKEKAVSRSGESNLRPSRAGLYYQPCVRLNTTRPSRLTSVTCAAVCRTFFNRTESACADRED